MTGGGDDSSSPYQGSYTWTNTTIASGTPDRHRHQRRRHDRNRDLHRHQRHHRPDRPDQRPRRRPLVHHPLRPTHTRLGLGRRLRPRQHHPSRRTRHRHPLERSCGTFSGSWSTVTLVGGADTTVTSGNCYRYRIHISDNVGNTSSNSSSTADAKVDTTAPSAPGLTLNESSPLSYVSGTTLYYNAQGSNTASFTVDGTSTDAQSGIQKLNFPSVSGMTGGGDDSSSPYQGSYTWTNTTTATGAQTVTATNGAGSTATATFTVTKDTTAPTGQTISLVGGPSYTDPSVPLTLDNGSDSGAGIDASLGVVERDEAPLVSGSCGSFSGSWTPITLTGGADTTVQPGNCYRYRYTITDNVGNASAPSSASADAMVGDATAPNVSATAPTPVTGTGNQSYEPGTKTLWFRPAGTGSFTLGATASDPESGISQVAFPDLSAVSGWSGTGGADTSSPYSSTAYSWSAGASAPGARTVTATNGANLTGTDTITIAADSTGPSGASAALSGGPWYSTLSVPLVLDNGSDSQSGVDSSSRIVERDSATLSNGSCGSFSGSWSTVTLSGGADTTVVSGNCYRYRLKISDNVANQTTTSASADAKVDTTAPSAPALTLSRVLAALLRLRDDAVLQRAGLEHRLVHRRRHLDRRPVRHPEAQLPERVRDDRRRRRQQLSLPGLLHLDEHHSASGTQTVTATNGAGTTATATFTVTKDITAPTGQTSDARRRALVHHPLRPTHPRLGLGRRLRPRQHHPDRRTRHRHAPGGSCGAFSGTWSTVTLVGGADTTVTSGNCYRYRISISDNVGNTSSNSTATADAKVDTSAPTVTATRPDRRHRRRQPALQQRHPLVPPQRHRLLHPERHRQRRPIRSPGQLPERLRHHRLDRLHRRHRHDQPLHLTRRLHLDHRRNPTRLNHDHRHQRRRPLRSRLTHHLRRLHRPHRPDRHADRRPLVHDPLRRRSHSTTAPTPNPASTPSSGLIERASATLTGGTCGTFGTWSTVTLTGGADTTVTSGNCYRYRYTITDNVGNTSSPSTATADAKIDTTAPSAPALTLTESSPLSHVSGTTLYYNAQGSNTASFTVDGTSTDAQSGIQKLTFPTVSGMTGGGDDSTSPYQGATPGQHHHRLRQPNRHRHQQRRHDRNLDLHRHQGHHCPDRPDRRPLGRALVHDRCPSR